MVSCSCFIHGVFKGVQRLTYQTSQDCLCCIRTTTQVCLHHVKTRKSGGCDSEWNLMPLCLEHHNLIHMKGLSYMSEKFTRVYRWLKTMGYEKCPHCNHVWIGKYRFYCPDCKNQIYYIG